MPTIYPFRGLRFNLSRVGSAASVVTQPYDKITDSLRRQCLDRSPYNMVRVIKNRDYQEAAEHLERWISEGILTRDPEPNLYAYEQEFEVEGGTCSRLGLVVLVSLDDEDLAVKGHETVLSRPLEDRLSLIRQTWANEGLVFTLYSDPALTVDRLLKDWTKVNPPMMIVRDDFGVWNRLWAIRDAGLFGAVSRSLLGRALYIADGHHRFQTSVIFHRECLDQGLTPAGNESFDKRMVALFNMDSEGVRILATHRGIRGLTDFDPEVTLGLLRTRFELTGPLEFSHCARIVETGEGLIGMIWNGSDSPKAYVLKRKWEDGGGDGTSSILDDLDVSILHREILNETLGIGPDKVAGGEYVSYYREKEDLHSDLQSGVIQLGFLLRATSLNQVRQVSEAGLRMPQKSTDFFPKLLSGLVMLKMDRGESGE